MLYVGTLKVSLSGFVSVFFEKVLKSKVVDLSVWDRNFQVIYRRTTVAHRSL